jgi:hypothetical protein
MTVDSPIAVALATRIDLELERATAALVRLAQPDGTPVPFGDAQWGPLALDPTSPTTLVDLQAGVLTTRWTWTRTDDFLAVRFGGIRRMHGHEDRLSLVWWAARRPVVVDPGTYSYAPTSTRTWLMSQAAHSVAIVRGRTFIPTERVRLVQTRMSGPLRRLLMTSTAYGVAQSRGVSVDSVNNSMQVIDTAAGMTLDQVFPLDPRWRLLTQGSTSAVLVDSTGARLMISTTGRITTVVRGAEGDDGGWVYAMSPARRFPSVRIVISGVGRVTTTMRVRGSSLPAAPAPRAPMTSPAPTVLP